MGAVANMQPQAIESGASGWEDAQAPETLETPFRTFRRHSLRAFPHDYPLREFVVIRKGIEQKSGSLNEAREIEFC
jgi:hypothetical protein